LLAVLTFVGVVRLLGLTLLELGLLLELTLLPVLRLRLLLELRLLLVLTLLAVLTLLLVLPLLAVLSLLRVLTRLAVLRLLLVLALLLVLRLTLLDGRAGLLPVLRLRPLVLRRPAPAELTLLLAVLALVRLTLVGLTRLAVLSRLFVLTRLAVLTLLGVLTLLAVLGLLPVLALLPVLSLVPVLTLLSVLVLLLAVLTLSLAGHASASGTSGTPGHAGVLDVRVAVLLPGAVLPGPVLDQLREQRPVVHHRLPELLRRRLPALGQIGDVVALAVLLQRVRVIDGQQPRLLLEPFGWVPALPHHIGDERVGVPHRRLRVVDEAALHVAPGLRVPLARRRLEGADLKLVTLLRPLLQLLLGSPAVARLLDGPVVFRPVHFLQLAPAFRSLPGEHCSAGDQQNDDDDDDGDGYTHDNLQCWVTVRIPVSDFR
jgi:hypothetical protein